MKKITAIIALSALTFAACGSDDDAAPAATEAAPVETDAAPVETDAAPVETDAAPVETDAAPVETDAASEAADPAGAIAIELLEWSIESPTELPAGPLTFDVTNGGQFPHHFAIFRGDSYETLPQNADGSVDEDALGADVIGRTDNLEGGEATTIEFDLEPGNYVFICNISGIASHAAQGQVLSVTVG